MDKQCEECGCSFTVDTSKRNWNCIKLCSHLCQTKRTTRLKREKYVPQSWPQHRKCIRCGNEFIVNGPRGSRQEYCSRTCFRDGREQERKLIVEMNRQSKICPICQKSFIPSRYHQKKQIYCSMKCYYKLFYEMLLQSI